MVLVQTQEILDPCISPAQLHPNYLPMLGFHTLALQDIIIHKILSILIGQAPATVTYYHAISITKLTGKLLI